jgi:hypothetical protein
MRFLFSLEQLSRFEILKGSAAAIQVDSIFVKSEPSFLFFSIKQNPTTLFFFLVSI